MELFFLQFRLGIGSQRVLHLIHEYSIRLKSCMHNTTSDLDILNYFRVVRRKVKTSQPMECFWYPPNDDELVICCDGAAKGNHGVAGASAVVKDANCNFVRAMSIGLGRTTNFLAELYGVIVGLEWALKWEVRKIVVRTNSVGALTALSTSNVPWFLSKGGEIFKENMIQFVLYIVIVKSILQLILWLIEVVC
ncbi:uncharacterized protein LOC113300149 [Papaver somniferum]|uniref:uncharacterized protein LOC113300149 n=1 Tax=Papaver somniferum TaxID=3469 RepID=UPI000E6F73FA|nr:uncharacterized protein LOC113300149 [Papaver somniferum]